MSFRLPALRRPRVREYAAGTAAVIAIALVATAGTGPGRGPSAIDLSAASRPASAHDIQDYNCWKAPSNSTCDNVTPGSYCYQGAYPVQLDRGGSKYWNAPGTNWWFSTELWYSPHCKSNWATTDVENADDTDDANGWLSAKIRRFDGPDGPYQMRQAPFQRLSANEYGGTVSPMIYSPHNLAQACGTNDDRTCGNKL